MRNLFFLLLFFILLFTLTKPALATGQTIKVMTFNSERNDANPGFSKCDSLPDQHKAIAQAKATDIAQYMKRNNIEIAMIQELYHRCKDVQTFEYEMLAAELQRIGYPMYSVTVPYDSNYGTFFQVATFSVYPINTSKVTYIPTYDAAGDTNVSRWGMVVPVTTDFGEVSVFNIHIQVKTACHGIRDFFDAFDAYPGNMKIMGGDFNNHLTTDECRALTTNYQLNRTGNVIDYLLFPNSAPFNFGSTFVDTSTAAPLSDHDPVVSTIITSLPISNSQISATPTQPTSSQLTPTKLPTLAPSEAQTTCALQSHGDADCKHFIDLLDYVCWKEEYTIGRRSRSCVNPDFDNMNGVSIDDFRIWLQNFKISNR